MRKKEGVNKSWALVAFKTSEAAALALAEPLEIHGELGTNGKPLVLNMRAANLETQAAGAAASSVSGSADTGASGQSTGGLVSGPTWVVTHCCAAVPTVLCTYQLGCVQAGMLMKYGASVALKGHADERRGAAGFRLPPRPSKKGEDEPLLGGGAGLLPPPNMKLSEMKNGIKTDTAAETNVGSLLRSADMMPLR